MVATMIIGRLEWCLFSNPWIAKHGKLSLKVGNTLLLWTKIERPQLPEGHKKNGLKMKMDLILDTLVL